MDYSSGKFLPPVSGVYQICAAARIKSGSALALTLRKGIWPSTIIAALGSNGPAKNYW